MPMQSTTADTTPARDAPVCERPILFSGPMVRAILDGSKSQTRRVVKPQPRAEVSDVIRVGQEFVAAYPNRSAIRPSVYATPPRYGRPGDRLWVRETFCPVNDSDFYCNPPHDAKWIDYRATPRYNAEHPAGWDEAPDDPEALKWRPSIFMPRAASRITLELIDVRVERLQRINHEDVLAEGIDRCNSSSVIIARERYEKLWDSLNAKRGYGWDVNPWVWVLSFRRVDA